MGDFFVFVFLCVYEVICEIVDLSVVDSQSDRCVFIVVGLNSDFGFLEKCKVVGVF